MISCPVCYKQFSSEQAVHEHQKHAHAANEVQRAQKMPRGVIAAGLGLLTLIIVVWIVVTYMIPGQYDALAQCIAASGTKFYGAFWCSHCQNQKKAFGSSAKYLPYIECSTPDGKDQLEVCDAVGITAYPTWIFSDGTQANELSPVQLAQRTNCPLPA